MRGWLIMVGIVAWLGCAPAGEIFLETSSGDRATLEFGLAAPGLVRSQTVFLHSRHGQQLSLRATVTNPAFEISFPEGAQLPAFGSREVLVRYHPTAEATRDEGSFTITTEVLGLSATLDVSGVPTEVDCSMPARLDFGPVVRGDSALLELPITNASRYETTVVIKGGLPPFSLTDRSLMLAAGETHVLGVRFIPEGTDDHFTDLIGVTRHHQLCQEQLIRLTGSGIATALTWSPAALDFGSVSVGSTARITIEFSNLQVAPVTLSDVRTISNGPFSVSESSLVVPGGQRGEAGTLIPGRASLEVQFSPPLLGARGEILSANVSGAAMPTIINVNLRGVGAP